MWCGSCMVEGQTHWAAGDLIQLTALYPAIQCATCTNPEVTQLPYWLPPRWLCCCITLNLIKWRGLHDSDIVPTPYLFTGIPACLPPLCLGDKDTHANLWILPSLLRDGQVFARGADSHAPDAAELVHAAVNALFLATQGVIKFFDWLSPICFLHSTCGITPGQEHEFYNKLFVYFYDTAYISFAARFFSRNSILLQMTREDESKVVQAWSIGLLSWFSMLESHISWSKTIW